MSQHAEAYCLMQYQADDGTETEVVWNSRDGVTPFVITLRSGKSATHTRWQDDVACSRAMADALGVRRFVDATEHTARPAAQRFVDQWWDHPEYPMSRRFATKRTAVEHFTREYVGDGNNPTLIEAGGADV